MLTCVLFFSHTNRVRQQCHNLTIKPKGKQNDRINLHYRFFAEKISFQKRGQKPEKSSQRCPVCLLGEKSCITDWLPKPPILRRKNCWINCRDLCRWQTKRFINTGVGNLRVMPILRNLPQRKALIPMKSEPLMIRTAFYVSMGLLLEMITKSMKKYQPILTALSSKASDAIKMSLPTCAVFMPLFPRPEIFIT